MSQFKSVDTHGAGPPIQVPADEPDAPQPAKNSYMLERRAVDEIIAQPSSAIQIVAAALGISRDEAKVAILSLVKAGFVVAPMEPTNSMFAAYIEALGQPTKRHETAIRNIGKARRRWKAMAQAGVAVAVSRVCQTTARSRQP